MEAHLFDVFWAMTITIIFAIVIGANVIGHLSFAGALSTGNKVAKGPVIGDFSRGRVVQVGNGGNLFRLTHLYNKAKGLFQFAEVVPIDKLGQPQGKPQLCEGDFEDIIDEIAGIPEGSLAHGHTPEFPDPTKPGGKHQASKRQKRLPAPQKYLPAPRPTLH